jgi:quinol monooxygenase YgiN
VSVTVLVELTTSPDRLGEVTDSVSAMVPGALAFDGCEGVTIYQNKDESTIILIEPWASRAHHETYLAWRTERGDLAALGPMLTAPPSIRYLTGVDAPAGVAKG